MKRSNTSAAQLSIAPVMKAEHSAAINTAGLRRSHNTGYYRY